MEPIINPIYFYILSISEKIQEICGFTCVALLVVVFISIIIYPIMLEFFGEYEVDFNKLFKKFIIMFVISGLLYVIVPPKSTCYNMIVASMVTEDNIVVAKDEAKNLIDYIVESVDKLIDNDKEE